MTLHEEALSTYEELEVLFFQVLKDRNLTWFGSLANPSPRDDSASLLSIERKPFRDLILANSISIFDFRMYLLARQCILLSGMGKIVDVGRRAIVFIQTFGKRLQEVEVSAVDMMQSEERSIDVCYRANYYPRSSSKHGRTPQH